MPDVIAVVYVIRELWESPDAIAKLLSFNPREVAGLAALGVVGFTILKRLVEYLRSKFGK